MTLVALNAKEWYPVYEVVWEVARYDLDEGLLRRYEAARDEHRRLLSELDHAYEAAIDNRGMVPH